MKAVGALLLAVVGLFALRIVFAHIATRDLQERIRRWTPPKE